MTKKICFSILLISFLFTSCKNEGDANTNQKVKEDNVEVFQFVVDIKTKEQQKDDEKSLQDRVVGAAQTTGKFTSDQVDKVKEKVDDMGDDARVK